MSCAHSRAPRAHPVWAPRPLVVPALALGIAVSLTGVSAGQTCGHYVKRLGPGFVPGLAAAEKVASEPRTMAQHAAPAKAPCPCQGPECRRSPHDQTPLPPGVPVRIMTPHDIIPLAATDVDFTLGRSPLVGTHTSRPLRGYPQGLNRPPCA